MLDKVNKIFHNNIQRGESDRAHNVKLLVTKHFAC